VIKRIANKISSSAPANYIVGKSKLTSFPGFRGIPLYDVVLFFIKQVKPVGMTERASAISFNLVMAIPPEIIFLFQFLNYIFFVNTWEVIFRITVFYRLLLF